jgi:hypothetical protein
VQQGVYIRRRDTDSRLNWLAGGRLFPGVHHHARFTTRETSHRLDVGLRSDDGATNIVVRGGTAEHLPDASTFRSLEEASAFFEAGSLGYSATADSHRFQGLELRCHHWDVQPLEIEEAHSSYFDDETIFPKGSIELDCALLMRGIPHEWHGKPDLCCAANAAEPSGYNAGHG